ncbi:MAG: hypothetical protein U5L72_13190 [Bacteroidales bacterium]|nr:hypothetical protein [Bacteroidales bacterium]
MIQQQPPFLYTFHPGGRKSIHPLRCHISIVVREIFGTERRVSSSLDYYVSLENSSSLVELAGQVYDGCVAVIRAKVMTVPRRWDKVSSPDAEARLRAASWLKMISPVVASAKQKEYDVPVRVVSATIESMTFCCPFTNIAVAKEMIIVVNALICITVRF